MLCVMCYVILRSSGIRPIHAHHKYNNTVTYVMFNIFGIPEQLPKMIKHTFCVIKRTFCVIKRDHWVIKQHDKTVIKPFHIPVALPVYRRLLAMYFTREILYLLAMYFTAKILAYNNLITKII